MTKTAQLGFSMVELMVALTISLFLLIAITQIFLGNRKSHQMHEGISRIQENSRFAMDIIGRQVRMAGHRSQPLLTNPLYAVNGRNNVTGGGDSEALAGSDKLILRYQGALDGTTVDCAGNSVNANENIVAVLLVNEDRSLRCAVNPSDVDKAVGQPLLNGISDIQFLFGERLMDRSTSPPTQYFKFVTADNVGNWSNIVSVRVDISADSVEKVDPYLSNGLLVKTYTSAFTIRNRI